MNNAYIARVNSSSRDCFIICYELNVHTMWLVKYNKVKIHDDERHHLGRLKVKDEYFKCRTKQTDF